MRKAEWRPCRLDHLGFVGRGRSTHRPRNAPHLYGGSIPFFQTGDVKAAGFWLRSYSQTYSEYGLAQSKLWPSGTLCLTIAANIADSAILAVPACFPDSIVGFLPDQTKADVRFVKYLLDTMRLDLQSVSRGTTQDNLSLDKLLGFELRVPALPDQRRIASTLSAYDDLIENCERRIRVLDEMARALYREWFVSFRYPGHEKVPLVGSPMGLIPKSWRLCPLNVACHLTMGQSPKSEFYNEFGEGVAFHQGVSDFGARFPSDRVFCTSEARMAEAGDILFSVRAPVGRINIAPKRLGLGRGLSAIRHREGQQAFLWEQLRARFTRDDMMGNGAIFAAVTKAEMENVQILCPPDQLVSTATRQFEPINTAIARIDSTARNLRRTRDLLLPRLLSGQINLSDAA
jgi:type I restriction enzyme, S subunit